MADAPKDLDRAVSVGWKDSGTSQPGMAGRIKHQPAAEMGILLEGWIMEGAGGSGPSVTKQASQTLLFLRSSSPAK